MIREMTRACAAASSGLAVAFAACFASALTSREALVSFRFRFGFSLISRLAAAAEAAKTVKRRCPRAVLASKSEP